jgi:hypothetical protein
MSPATIPQSGTLRLRGIVTNTSEGSWQDINVHAFVSTEPITTSAGLVKAAALPYDADVISTNDKRIDGEMEPGRAYPAEQLPPDLTIDGVKFKLGPADEGKPNALACKGQTIPLGGDFERVEILAAASDAETRCEFRVGETTRPLTIQRWRGYVVAR